MEILDIRLPYETVQKINGQIDAMDYNAVLESLQKLSPIESLALYTNTTCNHYIFNISLERLGLSSLIKGSKYRKNVDVILNSIHFLRPTMDQWVINRLDLFINTLARLLHQKKCGLIVMTYLCYHRYRNIIDIIDNDPTDPGRITMIMRICFRASTTRPVDQMVKLSPVKRLRI